MVTTAQLSAVVIDCALPSKILKERVPERIRDYNWLTGHWSQVIRSSSDATPSSVHYPFHSTSTFPSIPSFVFIGLRRL